MKRLNSLIKGAAMAGVIVCFAQVGIAQSILGQWKTIDDETGEAKAIVQITEGKSGYRGRIIEFLRPASPDNPDRLCKNCKGKSQNKPIDQISVIWGLDDKGNGKYVDGHIVDPESGKIYDLKAELKDGGQKLELRGFLGVSLLGRTQVWHRVK